MAEIDASTIAENATKPQTASQDGRSASQFSIQDQIAAAKFRATQTAAAEDFPLNCRQIVPPGST